jgi:hypothetical protein
LRRRGCGIGDTRRKGRLPSRAFERSRELLAVGVRKVAVGQGVHEKVEDLVELREDPEVRVRIDPGAKPRRLSVRDFAVFDDGSREGHHLLQRAATSHPRIVAEYQVNFLPLDAGRQ